MADVCTNISKLSPDIRKMLRDQSETKLNQTAALDGNKITDIKSSVGAYRRTPAGKSIIYTGHPGAPGHPAVEPNSRDIREMIEHKRPFICRAITAFGKPQAVCYIPGDDLYKFIKDDMERAEELVESLKAEITSLWGKYEPKNLTFAEEAFMRELRKRGNILDDILDELAPKVLKTCRVSL